MPYIQGLAHTLGSRTERLESVPHLRAPESFFTGFRERRVLGPSQGLLDLMQGAARSALERARHDATQVDILIGGGEPSEFHFPNIIADLHYRLGLRNGAEVITEPSSFAGFVKSLVHAVRAIRSQDARCALVVLGAAHSALANPAEPFASTVGDAAAACVVTANPGPFRILAFRNRTLSEGYGHIAFEYGQVDGKLGPTYRIDSLRGIADIRGMGTRALPNVILELLREKQIPLRETTIFLHQPTEQLLRPWREALAPARVVDTLGSFGNLLTVSVPLNLSLFQHEVDTRYIALGQIGLGYEFWAALLERG
jgi:3-oxoacyl-[acyl-carrier-protein] synthase III